MTEIQPELWVGDAGAAVTFYERAFGAVVEHRVGEPGEREGIAQLAVGNARFWVSTASKHMRRFSPLEIEGATGRMLLVVDDPEAVLESAVAAGATETSAVADEHGWRLGRLVDPFGHEWEVGHPLGAWPPA